MLRANVLLVTNNAEVALPQAVQRPLDASDQSGCEYARRDLAAAGKLQRMMLPPVTIATGGWSAVHRYQPAGEVSGDYVDVVPHSDRLYFMLGDVSGKGVAASMLMAQLRTMFRTLIPFQLPLEELMRRASALLCASSLPAQYATLVCGYLMPSGEVVISNAGHPPPLMISRDQPLDVEATGTPIGMFCESQFATTRLTLAVGDTLLIYSDGLTEATNTAGHEYGSARVEATARRPGRGGPEGVRRRCAGGPRSLSRQSPAERRFDGARHPTCIG